MLHEWLRGPRLPAELADQEALFPARLCIPFGPIEAARAAELYSQVPAPRGRELDIAIAACAMCWDARLWTLNVEDFRHLPGLELLPPG